MSPTPPFDESHPSPIATLLDLRASGHGAVVDAGRASHLQARMRVETGLAAGILALARSAQAPTLILITGSAGGGKSVLIDDLLATDASAFGDWIEDATHSDSPTEDQMDRLAAFLSPLEDGATPAPGPPLLLAMNTGMVIRFFDQLRDARGPGHSFTNLETTLMRRLAIDDPAALGGEDLLGSVAVVNLDGRATCGTDTGLFRSILGSLDPDDPDGVLGGSPRCTTCTVIAHCWTRTNAKLLSSTTTARVLDDAAGSAARERGRWPSPRELWDLASHLATGGVTFRRSDPCLDVVDAAAAGNPRAVWDGLLVNGPFRDPPSRLAAEVAQGDPSFSVSEEAHRILGSAGIDDQRDADTIAAALAAPGASAVATAASALTIDDPPARRDVARATVRALWLSGDVSLAPASPERAMFDAALAEYPSMGPPDAQLEALERFLDTVEGGFASSFGESLGPETYYRTEAHDAARPVAVHARAAIAEHLQAVRDPAVEANPGGAELVGHIALAIHLSLAGVEIAVPYPLFQLLAEATRGAVPSTQDLERFSSLKRSAEALGRVAAADRDQPLLFVVTGPSGRLVRYRASQRRDRFSSGQVVAVEDVTAR